MQNQPQVILNTEVIQHLTDAFKILAPFMGALVAMLVWAWNKMEKTQDKIEKAFIVHVVEDDRLHDQIFSNQRKTDAMLNELIGEHKATHHGGK